LPPQRRPAGEPPLRARRFRHERPLRGCPHGPPVGGKPDRGLRLRSGQPCPGRRPGQPAWPIGEEDRCAGPHRRRQPGFPTAGVRPPVVGLAAGCRLPRGRQPRAPRRRRSARF
jgi:hypothetical protein